MIFDEKSTYILIPKKVREGSVKELLIKYASKFPKKSSALFIGTKPKEVRSMEELTPLIAGRYVYLHGHDKGPDSLYRMRHLSRFVSGYAGDITVNLTIEKMLEVGMIEKAGEEDEKIVYRATDLLMDNQEYIKQRYHKILNCIYSEIKKELPTIKELRRFDSELKKFASEQKS